MKKRLKDPQLVEYFEIDLNGLIEAKIDLFPDVKKRIISAVIENIDSNQYRITAAFARKNANH